MKLRNQILRGFMLLGLLPLLAALYGMMFYSEHLFLRNVDSDVLRETERVGRLITDEVIQRGLILDALAESPQLSDLGKELESVAQTDRLTPEFENRLFLAQNLLTSIQPIVAEDAVIRLLDPAGRTILKVRFGSVSTPIIDTLLPYRIIENEPDADMLDTLKSLPDRQVSHVELTGSNVDFLPLAKLALLDAVFPIELEHGRMYLTYSSRGERLNRLLRTIPRFRDARISIGTRTPPQVLFDDNTSLPFGGFPKDTTPPPLYYYLASGKVDDTTGVLTTSRSRFYYTEIFPFTDQLINWVISAEIAVEPLLGFFQPLRWGVLIVSGIVFLLALLTGIGMSRRIAAPVSRLATNMKHYALGNPTLPDVPSKTTEINALQTAFVTMTTDLQHAEHAKAKAEKQLTQAERLASIGEMAAGIGHELNNPLNNILSLGKLIRHDVEGDIREDVDDLLAETRRASTIVAGILRFARQVPPEYQTVEVCTWLEDCVSRTGYLAEDCRVKVISQCQANETAEFDTHQIEQVIINLLTNAIQASGENDEVTIAAKIVDDRLVLEVIDNGEGMSETTREHLFEPFYTTKEVGEGSGLGLSISLGIIESHNGSLTLTPHNPRGVIARVNIPRTS